MSASPYAFSRREGDRTEYRLARNDDAPRLLGAVDGLPLERYRGCTGSRHGYEGDRRNLATDATARLFVERDGQRVPFGKWPKPNPLLGRHEMDVNGLDFSIAPPPTFGIDVAVDGSVLASGVPPGGATFMTTRKVDLERELGMSLTGMTLLPIGVRQVKGYGTGGSRGVSRTLIALALALLCSGCVGVGTAVRVATWHQDPSPFWIVVRDEGVLEDRGKDTDGSCRVVFGNRGLRSQDALNYRLSNSNGPSATLSCRRSPDAIDGASAYTAFHTYGADMPDLSLPKSEREGPRLLEEEKTAEMMASGLFLFELYGVRFGATLFCPTLLVHATSLRVVLNAGVDRDLHVIVGKGTRECSFP